MIRLQGAVKYRDGVLGARLIKELGDYHRSFCQINDEDDESRFKNALKR